MTDVISYHNNFISDSPAVVEVRKHRTCLVVGDDRSGKTPLAKSVVINGDESGREHDFGVAFFQTCAMKITVNGTQTVFEIRDSSGLEDYESLFTAACKTIDVFVACFAIDQASTFHSIEQRWIPQIRKVSKTSPIILVGTNSQLRRQSTGLPLLPADSGRALAEKIGAVCYIETSSSEDEPTGVVSLVRAMAYAPFNQYGIPVRRKSSVWKLITKLFKKGAADRDTAGPRSRAQTQGSGRGDRRNNSFLRRSTSVPNMRVGPAAIGGDTNTSEDNTPVTAFTNDADAEGGAAHAMTPADETRIRDMMMNPPRVPPPPAPTSQSGGTVPPMAPPPATPPLATQSQPQTARVDASLLSQPPQVPLPPPPAGGPAPGVEERAANIAVTAAAGFTDADIAPSAPPLPSHESAPGQILSPAAQRRAAPTTKTVDIVGHGTDDHFYHHGSEDDQLKHIQYMECVADLIEVFKQQVTVSMLEDNITRFEELTKVWKMLRGLHKQLCDFGVNTPQPTIRKVKKLQAITSQDVNAANVIVNLVTGTLLQPDTKEAESCRICFSGQISTALIPCGHMCLCQDCADTQDWSSGCPFCRVPVKQIVRVFVP
eukprot:GFYU01003664.1.p1 GENE.GFYU01003664.1~~GFYU01003664.1.p1  ORF type:complete len:600 (-),score=145.43 GFYU01003664.1:114-1913(-)